MSIGWRQIRAIARIVVIVLTVCILGCAPSEQVGGTVVIESEPENGALVMMGDQLLGETPYRMDGYPVGVTAVVLHHENYQPKSQIIEIPEAGEVTTVVAKLVEREAFFSISSVPPLAEVVLNGEQVLGITPLRRVPVPLGEHTYTLTRESFEPVTGEFTARDSEVVRRNHKLVPRQAWISVTSSPSGATVWVNDVPIEAQTPARIDLMPGDYTIGAYKEGYILSETGVRVAAEGEQAVEFSLVEGDVPPGMVRIPAGEFVMGKNNESPDERPERVVNLPGYYIDKREVTNLQFQQVYSNHEFAEDEARHPVTGVTWDQAVHYAESIGKRLPTEAEWEKAARGDQKYEYPWGDRFSVDLLNSVGRRGRTGVVEVGSYRAGASPYGCLDMAGNVYEWTSDWYGPYPGNTDIRTTYGQIYRTLRGGSYLSEPFDVRAARRHYDKPGNAREDYGFRCARDL